MNLTHAWSRHSGERVSRNFQQRNKERLVAMKRKSRAQFSTIPSGLPVKSTFGNDEKLNYGFREVEMRPGTVGRILSTSPPS